MKAGAAIVEVINSWPRCTCLRCIALDLRYPNDGYQLAFWRYDPEPVPGTFRLRKFAGRAKETNPPS